MRRRGFTLSELALTVAIAGTVTAMAIPKTDDLKRRTTASRILEDVNIVKNATYRFFSDSGYFPKDAASGTVPENLNRYLPLNYSFTRKDWTIDFQTWSRKAPSVHMKTAVQIAVSITTRDARLGATAMHLYGNNPKFAVGSKYTFLIVGP